jgi:hypothetical protein
MKSNPNSLTPFGHKIVLTQKAFFFKLYNSTLGYNNAIAHFVRGHSPKFTFCDLNQHVEIHNESALHSFFECRTVMNITDVSFERLTNMVDFSSGRLHFLLCLKGTNYSTHI